MAARYYIVKTGDDRYDMRQERFRGTVHPHDLMAVGFSAAQMRDMLAQHFPADVDTSALPPEA